MKRNIRSTIKNLSESSLNKLKKSILSKKEIIAQIRKRKNDILELNKKIDVNKISIKFDGILKEKLFIKNLKPSIWLQSAQDKVNKIFEGENNLVFLRQSRFWFNAISWTLISTAGLGVAWISIAKTEEIVIATGKLEPKDGVIEVQMPLEGVTRKIFIKEGEIVEKGDVLIQLDTDITNAKNIALQNNLKINENIANKLKLLVKEGAVSELQYLQQLAKVEDIKSEIKTIEVTLKYQEITAPSSGKVFDLQPKGPGFVARSSEPVMKIVPMSNLIAKVEIDSRSIGFVSINKQADISIDSFPASDFGVVEGKLISIGSDALPPEPALGKNYRFPAKIQLENQYLELKSGRKLPLQAGMSLTANIKLRKVTYLQLLLNKFTDRAESLKAI